MSRAWIRELEPRGLRGLALDDSFVRDIGVGPLVDADPSGTGRMRRGNGAFTGVGEDADADTWSEFFNDPPRDDGHGGRGFVAVLAGLLEGHVPVVFDDHAREAVRQVGPGFREPVVGDFADGLARVFGASGQRGEMHRTDKDSLGRHQLLNCRWPPGVHTESAGHL